MNLNLRNSEYNLAGSLTEESIRIYGVKTKFILTQKINQDLTFGDFSHIKANNKNCFEIYVMPENTDDFEDFDRLQTQFPGVMGDSTLNLFVSKITMREMMQKSENSRSEFDITQTNETIQKLHGSLIVLPSGKILEIVKIDLDVLGMSNLFLSSVSKNAYCLRCKTYIHKTANEIDVSVDIKDAESLDHGKTPDMFDSLEKYFDEMVERNDKQKAEISDRFERESDEVFGRF